VKTNGYQRFTLPHAPTRLSSFPSQPDSLKIDGRDTRAEQGVLFTHAAELDGAGGAPEWEWDGWAVGTPEGGAGADPVWEGGAGADPVWDGLPVGRPDPEGGGGAEPDGGGGGEPVGGEPVLVRLGRPLAEPDGGTGADPLAEGLPVGRENEGADS
jgi:hypothetical protein